PRPTTRSASTPARPSERFPADACVRRPVAVISPTNVGGATTHVEYQAQSSRAADHGSAVVARYRFGARDPGAAAGEGPPCLHDGADDGHAPRSEEGSAQG